MTGLLEAKRTNRIYELALDFDKRWIIKDFAHAIWRIYHVYFDKRDYLPFIYVKRVDQTKKGWHVYVSFMDEERATTKINEKEARLITLIIQSAFETDKTRTLYDYLRTMRNEKEFNLLFKHKNKFNVKPSDIMQDKLNDKIDNISSIFMQKQNRWEHEH